MNAEERLSIRIPAELKEIIKKAADADHRTLSSYILNATINQIKADKEKWESEEE